MANPRTTGDTNKNRVVHNSDLRIRRHRRSEWRRRWKPFGKVFLNNNNNYNNNNNNNSNNNNTEKNSLDDFESKKAKWLNIRMHGLGQPLAPYNTTQFLMDDLNVRESDFDHQIDQILKSQEASNHHMKEDTNRSTDASNTSSSTGGNNVCLASSHGNLGSGVVVGIGVGGHRRRCMSDSTPVRKSSEESASPEDFYSSPDEEQDFMQQQFFETYENIHAERINSMSKAELVKEYLFLERRCEELEDKLKEMEFQLVKKTQNVQS